MGLTEISRFWGEHSKRLLKPSPLSDIDIFEQVLPLILPVLDQSAFDSQSA
jgi:hypothetical protein